MVSEYFKVRDLKGVCVGRKLLLRFTAVKVDNSRCKGTVCEEKRRVEHTVEVGKRFITGYTASGKGTFKLTVKRLLSFLYPSALSSPSLLLFLAQFYQPTATIKIITVLSTFLHTFSVFDTHTHQKQFQKLPNSSST
jgi:hypothetical protein